MRKKIRDWLISIDDRKIVTLSDLEDKNTEDLQFIDCYDIFNNWIKKL